MCRLVSLGANTQDVVVLDPVAALGGGRHGPGGREADFPSPTKLERNGLTGAELGAQMAAENLLKLSKQRGLTYSGKREEVVTFDYVVTNN